MVHGSQEAEIARAVDEGNVAFILKVVEATRNKDVICSLLGKFDLRSFAEDRLCQALIIGNNVEIINSAKLLDALRDGEQLSATIDTQIVLPQDAECPLPKRHVSKKSGASARAARARYVAERTSTGSCWEFRPSPTPDPPKQTCEKVVQAFWEAEVYSAWQRGDAAELNWTLQLAEEAGVSHEKLHTAKQAVKHFAQAALDDALETTDSTVIAQAFRQAEELGVSHDQLAEARLVAAESACDPQLIEQEVAHAANIGVRPARIEEAKNFARLLREAEVSPSMGNPRFSTKGGDVAVASSGALQYCGLSWARTRTSTAWARHSRLDPSLPGVGDITERSSSSCCTGTTESTSCCTGITETTSAASI